MNGKLAPSTAYATAMVTSPLWATIAYAHSFPWVVGVIIVVVAALAWGTSKRDPWPAIVVSPGVQVGIAIMGILVGIAAIKGYRDVAGTSLLGDFLSTYDWAAGLALTAVTAGLMGVWLAVTIDD